MQNCCLERELESEKAGCSWRRRRPVLSDSGLGCIHASYFKEKFMKCLRDNKFENALCRNESKDYLEYRMDRQLMEQEPLEKLRLGDLIDGKPEAKTNF
uniref:Uncharacterized protein n=1 Tax=Suricata suricatta TaxID=37032 RepID=A0A673TB44_SURSU